MKRYKKGDSTSYTLGVYPALELLAVRPGIVTEVLLSSKGGRNEGIVKIRTLCASGGIQCTESDRVIERLSPKENCLAIGAFEVYAEDLDARAAHVVLVRASDFTTWH